MFTAIPSKAAMTGCVIVVLTTSPFAQQPRSAVDDVAAALGRAWSALAAGRASDAVAAADEVLAARPRDHRAITVKIEALAAAQPLRGLDVYEQWLRRAEDVFLIEPIARGTLEAIAAGTDTHLMLDALERLARAGVRSARTRLEKAAAGNPAADAALASLGDTAAASRLLDPTSPRGPRGEARVEALAKLGAAATSELRRMLTDGAAPTRAAAALALGRLESRDAVGDLQRLAQEADPLVRNAATVALARLGDAQAAARVDAMLQSPVPDVKLLAANAYAGRGAGPWVDAIRPLLQDRTGLVRLQAAALLATVEPDAARAALADAQRDDNPVVRAEAIRLLATPDISAVSDLPSLRRALRDDDAAIRMYAAAAILELIAEP